MAFWNSWWAGSNLGYPLNYYYQPLFHSVVAGIAGVSGWHEGRAYHAAAAIFYALGPVTLYALLRRFQQSIGISFLGGALYSLVSPAALLLPIITLDVGGHWLPARLHGSVVYGDTPNMAGLTLLPLAILLFDRARERRTPAAWAFAALSMASVPLTNFPAAIGLAWALAAYWLACEPKLWRSVLLEIGAVAALGFALFAPWLSPSVLGRVLGNTQQWMDAAGRFGAEKIAYYAAFAIVAGGGCALLHSAKASFATRFCGLIRIARRPHPIAGWLEYRSSDFAGEPLSRRDGNADRHMCGVAAWESALSAGIGCPADRRGCDPACSRQPRGSRLDDERQLAGSAGALHIRMVRSTRQRR